MITTTNMEKNAGEEHLFVKASSGVHAVVAFNGQGNNYFPELIKNFEHGNAELQAFILSASDELERIAETIPSGSWYSKRQGINFKQWIPRAGASTNSLGEDDNAAPAEEYLYSSPVSYPLIFLTQIAAYLNSLALLGTSHEQLLESSWLAAATGHSQGILSAVVLSLAKTTEEVKEYSFALIPLVMALGLQAQSKSNFELRKNSETSPMLAVKGLPREQLTKLIQATQKRLAAVLELQPQYTFDAARISEKTDMYISLKNGANEFIVSGNAKALVSLKESIASISAKPGDLQTRVPFSKRKPSTQTTFLSVTAPFHCTINQRATQGVKDSIQSFGLTLSATDLQVPVFSTNNGEDLRLHDGDLVNKLIDLQLVEENDLLLTVAKVVPETFTHIVTFGPGKSLARQLNNIKIGSGLCIVDATLPLLLPESDSSSGEELSVQVDDAHVVTVFSQKPVSLEEILANKNTLYKGRSWQLDFAPRLVRRQSDNKVFVETKFSLVTGKPPVLMSGMTPTTSFLGIDLVAACSNAGFIGELAAGGLARPNIFKSKLEELVRKIEPGVGITINMLYLNASQWGFQFPLVLEFAKAGYPIESITIGAGVPTPEKAEEIFEALKSAGISMIGFKPGSTQAIRDVLELARLNSSMNILLQWTSGRGGGHHSFEDFHEPLLATYAEIRAHNNVVLVVGSGFGDSTGAFPYLDGSWSQKQPFLRSAKMPVDAVLFGSRCMTAKEAATSPAVKQLIVDAPGLQDESSWDTSYTGDAGGVITVQSELGEPIHKIHTRGVRLWRKYDAKYFGLPRGEARDKAILADKETIIQELNEDFQKVYFGQLSDGSAADLEDMTYAQVLRRMVKLMYVRDGGDSAGRLVPNRWIDPSYLSRTSKMMNRTAARFLTSKERADESKICARSLETKPEAAIEDFISSFHECEETLLADEDVEFFVDLCKDLRNGKPVNFIPVIDGDLSIWFKKDSLWCSEQLDAVPDRDPGRVCVLHGPVAARFTTVVDEPIADILGGVHEGFIDLLSQAEPEQQPMQVNLLGPKQMQCESWAHVVMQAPRAVLNKKWVPNPIFLLCQSEEYRTVIRSEYEVEIVEGENDSNATVVARFSLSPATSKVLLSVFDTEIPGAVLQHEFFYRPELCNMPLMQSDQSLDEVKTFYRTIWDCKEKVSISDEFTESVTLSEDDILAFNKAIGRFSPDSEDTSNSFGSIDIATVAGWRPLIRALFADDLEGNLLKLVHLRHGYKLVPTQGERLLVSKGETIESRCRVSHVEIQPGVGKKIRVEGTLSRFSGKSQSEKFEWLHIFSEFLIRGSFADFENTFRRSSLDATVICKDPVKTAVLRSKSWLSASARIEEGDSLIFRLDTILERGSGPSTVQDVTVKGVVLRPTRWSSPTADNDSDSDGFVDLRRGGKAGLEQVGLVEFQSQPGEELDYNPVLAFIHQEMEPQNVGTMFESGGYQLLPSPIRVQAPLESLSYALASRDLNSIHRSRPLAILADLPHGQTIVHGMWTACMARRILEEADEAAAGDASRIAAYEVEFVGMVFPGDDLCVTLQHVGVVGGRKVVNVKVNKAFGSRELVMKGRAEIEQCKTAYLFTGQGSAAVGMGMDRYEESDSVRRVWDTADKHLKLMYGFSILQIVRENPNSLTVHFGGPQGKKIRDNYRAIRTEDPHSGKMVQLIKEIRGNTKSFTFNSPQGLLFATQFSQPALVLVQKAAFEELVEGGFVPDDAMFAGHSLGEYAALASFADVLSIEALVETVFLRGMVMQNAVPRDSQGRSNYGMVAANPSRVSPSFTHVQLEEMVILIENSLGALIQIVNFNVRGSQYVVAGELVALDALSEAMKTAAGLKSIPDMKSVVEEAAAVAKNNYTACIKAGVPFGLRRGLATIPLSGIDVPFHSKKLLSGVPAFRQLLEPRLEIGNIGNVVGRLVGKYIPNVIAEPFALDRSYFERVLALTESPSLQEVLENEGFELLSVAEKARTLVVELLAHQFAMPVQWIKTQDVIFHGRTQRVIEMGPAATLATMAKRTLQSGIYGDNEEYNPEILWWKQDSDAVFYNLEDFGVDFDTFADTLKPATVEEDMDEQHSTTDELGTATFSKPIEATPVFVPQPVAALSSPLEDAPVSAKHVLRILLAFKFKKAIEEIKDSSTVKDLSGGKSAVQNEVVGEIAAEFGGQVPDNGAEMPLSELSLKVGTGYSKLGKVTEKIISKVLANSLPGGFSASAAKQYLSQECGLGPGRVDSVLAHAIIMQPEKRLAGQAEAKQWLNNVRDAFAADAGISLASPTSAGLSSMMMPVGMMSSGAPAAQPIPDAPVSAKHALAVLLASKFNKPLSEVNDSCTIKQLSAGKSAIQNEIVGDLTQEFGSVSESAAELPLAELATKFPAYSALGKVSTKSIGKMLGAKLPGGFSLSAAKQYLADERLLGPGRCDSVLLHALTMQPDNRLESPTAAKQWLDSVCDKYGGFIGLTIPSKSSCGPAMTGMMMPGMSQAVASGFSSESLTKLIAMVESQVESFNLFLGVSPDKLRRELEEEQALRIKAEMYVSKVQAELGEPFCDGVQPQHDAKKVRTYDSYWNWVVQDALDMHSHVLNAVSRLAGFGVESNLIQQNDHYSAMAEWIAAPRDSIEAKNPPQAWFRNYLCNRATPELLEAVRHFSRNMRAIGQHEYAQVITLLAEQVESWINRVPVHIALFEPMAPRVCVDDKDGSIKYFEEPRVGVSSPVEYVEEMSRGLYYYRGSRLEVAHPSQSVQLSADAALQPEDDLDGAEEEEEEIQESDTGDQLLLLGSSRKPRSETELMEKLSVQAQDLPRGPRLDAMRKTIHAREPKAENQEQPDTEQGSAQDSKDSLFADDYTSIHVAKKIPYIHLKSPSTVDKTVRILNERLSSKYLSAMHDIAVNGVSFAGQVALITGAGSGSIAEELVKAMLEGGATVLVTLRTSRSDEAMKKEFQRFRKIYEEFGAKGSKLILEPANCASVQDIKSLISHIYDVLSLDIDFVVPFAAAPERGKDISNIDSESETAHRMMLTNVVRLLGEVKKAKEVRSIDTRPAMVLLPCSPNHGDFGNDGLYAESKLGCESLVNKWASEGWSNYLCLAAAVIGWTRSALMWQNNIVAPGVEHLGCRTFSPAETVFNLVGLLHPKIVTLAAEEPLWADLTGSWITVPNLNKASQEIRARLQQNSKLVKSKIAARDTESRSVVRDDDHLHPLANPRKMCPQFPTISKNMLSPKLEGMVDLRKVVVVVGFGEIGPWGNARTRWEMEAFGEFSLEGAIELAWMVGFIKPSSQPLANNPSKRYIGWVDVESGQPVQDHEIKRRYEKALLEHCGIRIVEPALFEGYDPTKKTMLHRVAIDHDLPAIEVSSREEGLQYRKEIGDDLVDIFLAPDGEERWMIRIKKGAVISIPKAMRFNRTVAGQIPTGWDAKRLGIPADIADSVDPVTLFTIVSTVEALISSGLTDPYELYQYVHVSEVGNVSGGGMGGMRSLKRMFFDRKMDDDIPSDTLAESFINTMPAWVNMLLLSSSGPIKTPVGACATAAESIDIGIDTIVSGKARMVLAGGYDDFGETGSYEFAQMGATNNSELDKEKGRSPAESSRPMTDTRAGFVEAHGAGIQVLMDAELAIEMGCPIYGILALSNTATDKQGRSVPAPGRGILTTAREVHEAGGSMSPMLDFEFRKENLESEMEDIKRWKSSQQQSVIALAERVAQSQGQEAANVLLKTRMEVVNQMEEKKKAAAWDAWGQGFYRNDPTIAPLRGALAVWGLTVDDIQVGSFHGTSTKLNDKNESGVVNKQMQHLGRTEGNIMLVISQKYLTGHPKGAACAWMLNGLMQTMLSGCVPGNRNLDNVSPELRKNTYLFYPNRSIQLQYVKAAFLKSFGFGQAGAEILLVHPNFLLSCLSENQLNLYSRKRAARERKSFRYSQGVFSGKHTMVQVKSEAPYSDAQEENVYLNPSARARFDNEAGTWKFGPEYSKPSLPAHLQDRGSPVTTTVSQVNSGSSLNPVKTAQLSAETRLKVTMEENALGLRRGEGKVPEKGVGVDVEPVKTFEDFESKSEFITRNFTALEREYCQTSPSPAASFAGRWAAKEAVVKAISSTSLSTRSLWQGAGAQLSDIEILHSTSGAPEVRLHGHAKQVFDTLCLSSIKVSISHTADVAVAQAMAQ